MRAALAAIVGPTAVGKSEIAIRLAGGIPAEIVSADSRLLYRGMDIGTAKPSREQLREIPHHMIDVADPHESWSVAKYKQHADQAIEQIQARARLPLLVGGTGQYVTAVLEGWTPPPKGESAALRLELEAFAASNGAEALHARLAQIDPERAAQLNPSNVRRVVRALEIYQITGQPPSALSGSSPPEYPILRLGLSLAREVLYQRIDRRIDTMLAAGFVDEVQQLLDLGIRLEHPAMSAIGYRQIAEHLLGMKSLEDSVRQVRRLSRQLVRRQANWFKPDDPRIEWFPADEQASERMLARIAAWLRDPEAHSGGGR